MCDLSPKQNMDEAIREFRVIYGGMMGRDNSRQMSLIEAAALYGPGDSSLRFIAQDQGGKTQD